MFWEFLETLGIGVRITKVDMFGDIRATDAGYFKFMPFQFKSKEIKAEELTVKIEITLQKCSLDAQEVADRLAYVYNSSQDKGFSEFIVSLLRNARASTWELKKLEVD